MMMMQLEKIPSVGTKQWINSDTRQGDSASFLCCKNWWVTIQYTLKMFQEDISKGKRFHFFSNASANCFLLKFKDENECSTSSLLSLNGQCKWRNSVWCSKSLWGCCKSPGSSVFVFLFPCSDEISSQILPWVWS